MQDKTAEQGKSKTYMGQGILKWMNSPVIRYGSSVDDKTDGEWTDFKNTYRPKLLGCSIKENCTDDDYVIDVDMFWMREQM